MRDISAKKNSPAQKSLQRRRPASSVDCAPRSMDFGSRRKNRALRSSFFGSASGDVLGVPLGKRFITTFGTGNLVEGGFPSFSSVGKKWIGEDVGVEDVGAVIQE